MQWVILLRMSEQIEISERLPFYAKDISPEKIFPETPNFSDCPTILKKLGADCSLPPSYIPIHTYTHTMLIPNQLNN